ncbi:hypothetical protein GGD81_004196 [Rhodobium orientis]|uniref:Uncharacterized protein n=2 Tax=Hyphomicrobiales TaxID=356 RepID=A0A327JKQ2_9HYPH|nr:hypothetical protein [Rhodobium orientis]MBB4305128.1 hypothetical protein [Rhodobium orientis]MBK5950903.1 hypothetical protein [Rhodobium orientis]RAI27020.1 hypothetical protein CH339_11800 [Rhodobium orientis]
MNYFYDPKENERVASARESFSGRLLTDRQFDEAMAITGIIEREIVKSGAFKDKLGDYSYAFARSERFDTAKAETVLRDLFKERTGQSMNDMRKEFAERAEKLTDEQRQGAYQYAVDIGVMVENGDKLSFNRAFAHQSQTLGQELSITDAYAKSLMIEEFRAVENAELFEWGKELDERFYRPQIEAEKAEREAQRSQEKSRSRSSDRGGTETRSTARTSSRPRGPEMRR